MSPFSLACTCQGRTMTTSFSRTQSRLRIFLVGTRFPATRTTAELLLTRPRSLLPDRLRASIAANGDLQWFCIDIPEPPPLNTDGLSRVVEQLSDSDSQWWPTAEVQRHLMMMTPTHRDRVSRLAEMTRLSYRSFFRRRRDAGQRAEVRNDDLAGCLRTAVGGSGKQFLIEAGEGRIRMRAMTAREYARLQGVPDEYPVTANGVQALTGFGDAVCVPAISWIAANVLNPAVEPRIATPRRKRPPVQLALLER